MQRRGYDVYADKLEAKRDGSRGREAREKHLCLGRLSTCR